MALLARESPASAREAAAILRDAAAARRTVRPIGGGTKATWATSAAAADVELSTTALDRVAEHNVGDLTAVLQAGVRLADAQAAFAAEGQMLTLDPPLGDARGATIGGVFATADSGPLRHRYGAPRDLVLGLTAALADGTVARSGGKVIKNVAGYDLAKLFTGSFGTLGTIVEVVVRLHPLPRATATLVARSDDPGTLARAALTLAHAPLELGALDVAWDDGRGAVLARFAGATARERAARSSGDLLPPGRLELELVD
ncbi:MAG: FAD-binding oxidoreductase, partial [Actinobacteria bacterium]|nr:FAD-binding oxidoreductase [Actinomycetota bacterium]